MSGTQQIPRRRDSPTWTDAIDDELDVLALIAVVAKPFEPKKSHARMMGIQAWLSIFN